MLKFYMFFVVVLAPLLSIETSFFASATKLISKKQQKESCQLLLDYGISSSKCLEKLSNTRLQREKHSVEIACDALVGLKGDGHKTAFRCYSENFSKLVTSDDRFGQLNGLKICSLMAYYESGRSLYEPCEETLYQIPTRISSYDASATICDKAHSFFEKDKPHYIHSYLCYRDALSILR